MNAGATYVIQRNHYGEHEAVFSFSADELRGIAGALGHHDAGAQELLRAADDIDAADGELQ